jgi:hypothetical protein
MTRDQVDLYNRICAACVVTEILIFSVAVSLVAIRDEPRWAWLLLLLVLNSPSLIYRCADKAIHREPL